MRWTVQTPHFNLSFLIMCLLVQKRLALQVLTNPTMLLCRSGVKSGVRQQFVYFIFGQPRLCAATRFTAFSFGLAVWPRPRVPDFAKQVWPTLAD